MWNLKTTAKGNISRPVNVCRQKIMEYSIINPALLLLMKHLVIGQRQKDPNFSAFHWSPHVSLDFIGQHFVTSRVVKKGIYRKEPKQA